MISKKTKYGLQSLLFLARAYQQGDVLIGVLAKEEKIPQKFLEAILLQLKNHGLLRSKKGKGGGYRLNRPPQEITLGQVIRILEGPIAPVSCVSQTAYQPCLECKDEASCAIRLVMQDVRDAISNVLDKTTLGDMLKRTQAFNLEKSLTYFI